MAPPYTLHAHGSTPERTATLRSALAAAPLEAQALRVAADAAEEPAPFDAAQYFAHLQAERIGAALLTAAALPSTQTLMADNVDALPDGAVCVADVQVSGKGRGDNVWTSPPGCLMFSFNTRVSDGRTLPFLQYVVTLALVDAVQDAAREALSAAGLDAAALDALSAASPAAPPGASRRVLDVRIKWPNDVYAGGAKVGGVLCGSTFADGCFRVTVGVGLNVANAAPTTCLNALLAAVAAAAGAAAPAPTLCPAALLARALSRYEALERRFVADGFAPLQAAYLYHWLHSGQRVTLEEPGADAAAPPRTVQLIVQGLTPGGYLLAVDDLGQSFELHPDGNRLDFFQGLIRKKI